MKFKHYFCCISAACVTSTGASAAVINLVDQGGVRGSPAERGFETAARYWESVLTNDVTINIGISYAKLKFGRLGGTDAIQTAYSVGDWEQRIAQTRSDSLLDQMAVLPALNAQGGATFVTNGTNANGYDDSTILRVVDGDAVSSKKLFANTSVLKAIGALTADDPTYGNLDGSIIFTNDLFDTTGLDFDFDPSDGLGSNSFDFIAMAIHELGHALGFISGIDALDEHADPYGQTAGTGAGSLVDTPLFTPLDMFRYSDDPKNMIDGDAPVLDLSIGTKSYFSIDGGKRALFDNAFSTGGYNGDGYQASHWRDNIGSTFEALCNTDLGLIDPLICPGQIGEVTALDLAAFDAIGWNLNVDVLTNPGYRMSTAEIYRRFTPAVPEPATWAMMLAGFAMVGGMLRARRSETGFEIASAG